MAADDQRRKGPAPSQSMCLLLWILVSMQLWIATDSALDTNFEAAFQGSCTEKNPCEQTCFDLHDGTFECGCRHGYILSKDGYSCKVSLNGTQDEEDDIKDDEAVNSTSTKRHLTAKFVQHQVVDGRKTKPLQSFSHTIVEESNNIDNTNTNDNGRGGYDDDDEDDQMEDEEEQYSYESMEDGFLQDDQSDMGLVVIKKNEGDIGKTTTIATMQSPQPMEEISSTTYFSSSEFGRRPDITTPSLESLCEQFQCEGLSSCVADGNGGVKCLCPLGRGGDHCEKYIEVRFPKFGGRSHVEMAPLRNAYKDLQFTLEFRPEKTSGLLLYSGEQRNGFGDFVSLAIVDGHLEFRFDCGSGVGLIRSNDRIVLHSWNKVTVFRHRWDGWLQLNDGEHDQGRSKGLFSRISFKENLFLGGVPNAPALATRLLVDDGFNGCVRYLEINGHVYDFRPVPKGDVLNGRGIGECSAEVCNNVECKNGGKCIANSADSALCLCPLGFGGDYCGTIVDLVMPSFNGTSYLKYPGLGSSVLSFVELTISFKPVDPDGLFFYNGFKSDGTGDFLSLSLSAGMVEFRFDLGTGPAVIRSSEPVSLHEWHSVFVSRTARHGVMIVDNQPRVEGMSPGAFTQLSMPQNLYVGGVPSFDIISHKVGVKTSFRGCVQKVEINDKPLKLFEAALVGVNVENCNHPCVDRPCLNHGLCVPKKDYFTCHCLLGYADSRCQTEIRDNITYPMFMGNSFLRYTKPEIIKRIIGNKFDIEFKFRTLSSEGLLMWTGHREMTTSSDFVAVGLQAGFVHLRFNLGSGETIIRDNLTKVDDGRWHTITVFRIQRVATLIVDNGQSVNGTTPGSLVQVNTDTGFYIGGVPDPVHLTLGKYSTGFVGCVSKLRLNRDHQVRLVSDAQGGLNIEACV